MNGLLLVVVVGVFGEFELLEELKGGIAGDIESVGDDAGMKAFGGVAVGLFEEFSREEDCGCGAVSGYFVLLDRERGANQEI